MDKVDKILEQFTDPLTGSVHGAVFIAIDSSGTAFFGIYVLHLLRSALHHLYVQSDGY